MHITIREKSVLVTAKKTKTNRTKSEFTSHFGIAAKTNLLFPTRYAYARYTSWMIDRFLNWGDHGKLKSGKIKGRCQPPLAVIFCLRLEILIEINDAYQEFVL